ncbi:Pre-mRNA-splicing factor cwc15 [Fusarium oxysporum f. sp. albedinis]|nr:Pre-mRNA-splicing factor cwc15 [Fusarium oxysporum f. sp. albedinis]
MSYHQKSQLRTSQKEIWRFFLSLSILRINSSLSSSFNSRALFAFSLNPSTAPTPVPSSVYIPANRTRDLSKSGCSS